MNICCLIACFWPPPPQVGQPLDERAVYAAEVELAAERAAVREPLLVVVRLCDNQFALCMTPYRVFVFSLPDAYHVHPDDAQEVAKVRGGGWV